MPLEVFAKLDIFEQATKEVRKVQDTSIGAIYDLIRKVNHEVAALAKELLDGRELRPKAAKRPTAKRAAATRGSAAPSKRAAPLQPQA